MSANPTIRCDSSSQRRSDAVRKLEDVEGIATMRFSASEVVRHPIVGRIVEAYEGPPKDA